MKNIHVLPTDKPSRLYLFEERLILGDLVTVVFKNSGAVNQNIYITSDEEIKEGDWFITEKNTICKCVKVDEKYAYSIEAGSMIKKNCKKIILTTDPDLIKDGVQAIDDDFLEWFVNNPSCESVKVEDFPMTEKYNSKGEYVHRSYWVYKIIIPKEELLQGAILKLTSKSDLQPYTVLFSNERKEMLKLCPNGDIFVHGRLADNDKQVVDALRDFLRSKSLI